MSRKRIDSWLQDFHYASRLLLKSPGSSLLAVLTLAVGIAASNAVFTVVNSVWLRPLAYPDPDRLVIIWATKVIRGETYDQMTLSSDEFVAWRENSRSFTDMTAARNRAYTLTGNGPMERIAGLEVSPNFFPVLGLQPFLGRAFGLENSRSGQNRVAVLSHSFWMSHFSGDPNLDKQRMILDGEPYQVMGVLPPGSKSFGPIDYPFLTPGPFTFGGDERGIKVLARLKDGVTVARAQEEMNAIVAHLGSSVAEHPTLSTRVIPLHQYFFGEVRPILMVLFSAVTLLLLVACANTGNLLLARAEDRKKEMAVRATLGAGGSRLVQQLLTESLLLAVLAGTFSLILTWWGLDVVKSLFPPTLPRSNEIYVDGTVLAFTAGVSLLAGIIFGLFPAFQLRRLDLNERLKEGSRTSTPGVASARTRQVLLIAEVSLSVILLIGAGLMIRTLDNMLRVDLGFEPDDLHIVFVGNENLRGLDLPEQAVFTERLLDAIRAVPGVDEVGSTNAPPLNQMGMIAAFRVGGREFKADYRVIDPSYFQVMRMPLKKGRSFSHRDQVGAPEVAIVSESMARQLWPGEDPIGKHLEMDSKHRILREVVGIVGDVRRHNSLVEEPAPTIYVPFMQDMPSITTHVIFRTRPGSGAVIESVRERIAQMLPGQPLGNVHSMEGSISFFLTPPRFHAFLFTAFAVLSLVIGAAGIYGVTAYFVAQRTHEIGIRMALGADRRSVQGMVVRQGIRPVLLGTAFGLAGAWVLSEFLSKFLYAVNPRDLVTFVAIPAILIAVALLACYLPARRATKVDPMMALRND